MIGPYVARGTLWLLAALLFQQLMAFATAFAALRIADAAVYGSLVFLVSAMAIPVALVSQGLPQAATHFVARFMAAEQKKAAMKALALIRWLVAGAGLVFVTAVPLGLRLLPRSIAVPFDPAVLGVLIATAVVLRSLLDVNSQASLGLKSPSRTAAIESFLPHSLRLIAILILLPLLPTATGILLCHVAALALAVALGQAFLPPAGLVLRKPELQMALPLLVFGWPLVGAEVLSVVLFHADKILLGYMADPSDVAVYGVASRLAFLVPAAHWASGRVLAPVMVELWTSSQIAGLRVTYQRAAQLLLVITGVTGALVIANAPWLLPLFGSEFVDSELVSVVRVLTLALCFTVLSGHYGQLYRMTGKTKVPVLIAALGASLNVGLNVLLIPKMGILGAAWATAVAFAAMSILGGILLLPTYGGRIHPFGEGYLVGAGAAAAALAVAMLAGGHPIGGTGAALLFGAVGLAIPFRRLRARG